MPPAESALKEGTLSSDRCDQVVSVRSTSGDVLGTFLSLKALLDTLVRQPPAPCHTKYVSVRHRLRREGVWPESGEQPGRFRYWQMGLTVLFFSSHCPCPARSASLHVQHPTVCTTCHLCSHYSGPSGRLPSPGPELAVAPLSLGLLCLFNKQPDSL